MGFSLSSSVFLSMSLSVHHVSGITEVEGFDGGAVVLPCTLSANGDLTWRRGTELILVKAPNASVIFPSLLYNGVVSLVNNTDLRISPLRRSRDGNTGAGVSTFECDDTAGGKQEIRLVLLVKIAKVGILEAVDGRVTVTAGTLKTLTCSVTGEPDPPPSFNWSISCVTNNVQNSSSCTFTPSKSMETINCTAINRYGDGSVLSVKEATATLNVQYLDTPSVSTILNITENSTVTFRCSVEGNPLPTFEWRNNTNVFSQSPDYTIENVQRSSAGKYTCGVHNTVTNYYVKTNLIVQYPPDVRVSYDKISQTLTCTAEGVPRNYNFSPWEHRLDGKLLQTLGTQSSGSTATLKLPGTLTYEDTGYYVCQASNGIKSPQRGQVLVTPQSPPIFGSQPFELYWKEGETKSISVSFYTYSDTPNVAIVWKKSGKSTALASHIEQTVPIKLIMHGQSVSIQGTVTVLVLTEVTQSDEGNYTVTVTNEIMSIKQANHKDIFLYIMLDPLSKSGQQSGLPVAPIAGGVAGAVTLILVIVIVIIVVRRRSVYNNHTDKMKVYGSFSGRPGMEKHKSDSKEADKGTRSKGPKLDSNKDEGRENEAFSDERWKQPDAEIVVNDCVPHSDGHKSENSSGAAVEYAQPFKGRGLNYQEIEFDKTEGKAKIHPRESPVTYADIKTLQSGKSDSHTVA